jgi:hypothetical protein
MMMIYDDFILGVLVCLCVGDITVHKAYRYEWLHMMIFMLDISICI